MCGEHPPSLRSIVPTRGSSPRVWGARVFLSHHVWWLRLIPTCVGSTTFAARESNSGSAHPHVCGEHSINSLNLKFPLGSSPRVWGAPTIADRSDCRSRLIPTCVGSTSDGRNLTAFHPAHPHVCGEHNLDESRANPGCGSSPRVWGALEGVNHKACVARLIPTCVGSTRICPFS